MAGPMYCNTPECDQVAVVLQTMLEDGATAALCFGHYVAVCRAIVESIDQAERDQAATEAATALGHVTAPAPGGDGPTVVRRGTSRSRQAYEARRRAATAQGQDGTTTGPSDDPGASVAVLEGGGDDGTARTAE